MEIVSWLSKQASKIADNFNSSYQFYVKCMPSDEVDSSSILSLTAYTNKDQSGVVPCIYKWLRIKNGIAEERDSFRGNSYLCDLSDVGSTLQVQITSSDQQHPGTAVFNFGPITLDAVVKESIKAALSKGYAKFYTTLQCCDRQLQCRIEIAKSQIIIIQQKSGYSFAFPFSINNPMINYHQSTHNKLSFIFDEETLPLLKQFLIKALKPQKIITNEQIDKIVLRFKCKRVRDQFWLLMRIFNAQKQLKKSAIIHKIQRINLEDDHFSLMVEIQSLRSDLLKMYKAYSKERQDKFTYFSQNMKLQEEISEILSAYSTMFNEKIKIAQTHISHQHHKHHRRSSSIIQLMESYKQLEKENKALNELIIKNNSDKQAKQIQFQYHLILRIEELEKQNIRLKQIIEKLEANPQKDKSMSDFDQSQTMLEKHLSTQQPSSKGQLNPQNHPSNDVEQLKELIIKLQIDKNQWKVRLKQALTVSQKEREEHQSIKNKLQKKIDELNDQILLIKRRDDAMNRSYSLSIELEDYNYEQNLILREQNDFLLSQAQKLSKLCQKYKGECKKLKQAQKVAKQ